jgi:transcriptional regulator with XRE-family HTH domain
LRQQAGLSIRSLAAKSGVDPANISRLERGEATEPRPESLTRLAEALGVDPADLFVAAGYATPDALPSFTPYLRTKYGHLPASKRQELAEFFEQIEAEYGSKQNAKPKPKEGGR